MRSFFQVLFGQYLCSMFQHTFSGPLLTFVRKVLLFPHIIFIMDMQKHTTQDRRIFIHTFAGRAPGKDNHFAMATVAVFHICLCRCLMCALLVAAWYFTVANKRIMDNPDSRFVS